MPDSMEPIPYPRTATYSFGGRVVVLGFDEKSGKFLCEMSHGQIYGLHPSDIRFDDRKKWEAARA